jgi:hypothetical protein
MSGQLPPSGQRRNFLDFVTLTPGVVRDSDWATFLWWAEGNTLNSIQIDGVDNNNMFLRSVAR